MFDPPVCILVRTRVLKEGFNRVLIGCHRVSIGIRGSCRGSLQREPEVVLGPSVLFEAWGTKAQQPRIFKQHHSRLENVWFSGLGTPGLQ